MKMLDKTEQSDRAANPNEKPENCYCSALPKGSGLCLPCYTRWLIARAFGITCPSQRRERRGRRGRNNLICTSVMQITYDAPLSSYVPDNEMHPLEEGERL